MLLSESSIDIEAAALDQTRPFAEEVSRVLEFGGGKEDDEPLLPMPLSVPVPMKKQMSFLVVVRYHYLLYYYTQMGWFYCGESRRHLTLIQFSLERTIRR